MRFQLLQQELVQHSGREKRLFIAKGFPDKNERHHGLPPGIQPESVQGIQRLLCGLVEGDVEQETAVVLPAALIGENVVLAVLVQPVKAVVLRNSLSPAGPYWLRRVFSRRLSRKMMSPMTAIRMIMEKTAFMCASPR